MCVDFRKQWTFLNDGDRNHWRSFRNINRHNFDHACCIGFESNNLSLLALSE